jgi:hypothetical protein
MSCLFRWSRCALAPALSLLVLYPFNAALAERNGRAPVPAMAQEDEFPAPPDAPAYAYIEDGGSGNGPDAGPGAYYGGAVDGGYGGAVDGGYDDGCYGGNGFGDYGDGCMGGCYGCDRSACNCCPPVASQTTCRVPRFAIWADWLYLQVTDADVAHAQQQNGLGIGGTSVVPFGEIGTVEMEYDHGTRIGGSFGCDDCSRVLFNWTYFETESSDSLDPPTAVGGGQGAVGSFVHHPSAIVTGSVGPVDAFYEIDFQLADVMYNRVLISGSRYCIGLLLGAQYGHLEQRFAQFGEFSGAQGGVIDTATSIEFDGGGLKAGLDCESRVGSNFSVYGRLTGAAMSGRFRSRYSMVNTTGDILLAQSNWSDDRIVPQLEYEIGLTCKLYRECLRLSAGYMFSHWFNTVTTPEFIEAVRADNYVDVGDTLSFDGLVARVEASW